MWEMKNSTSDIFRNFTGLQERGDYRRLSEHERSMENMQSEEDKVLQNKNRKPQPWWPGLVNSIKIGVP